MNLPEEHVNIYVTYEKTTPQYVGSKKEVVTKRGFYLDGKFRIPPEWQHFRMGNEYCLLPHGFGGDHLTPEQIISWEHIK